MATSKITLIGFNDWMESKNDDLFKFLQVPSGIDKDILINTILMNGGEFEVLYANPEFMQIMIGKWSAKWMHTMERWINVLQKDYEPLENYDRKEHWVDNNQRANIIENSEIKNNVNSRSTSTDRIENANAVDNSESIGSGTTTNTRSAYDSSTYQPHDKSESASDGKNISTSSTIASGNVTDNQNEVMSGKADAVSNNIGNELLQRNGRAYGNIGVTTSQQMLQSELDLYYWNLYDEIANLFLNEFVIYVY